MPAGDAELYRRVSRSLRRIAGDDANDCVQEALARAIAKGVSLDAEPWLRTVAKRIAIDKVRRSREYAEGAPEELEGYIRDHDGDPQEALVRAEQSAELRKALQELPERYREALMAYAEDSSRGAVAARLGLTMNAASTLLSRARSRLRLQLENVAAYIPVGLISRARWKGLAIGGAAVATTAAIATAPIGHHRTTPPATIAPSAAVRAHLPAKPHVGSTAANKKPAATIPALPMTVPPIDTSQLSATPKPEAAVTACLAPDVPDIVGVDLTDAQRDASTLLDAVTSKLPEPAPDVDTHLCE